MSPGERSQVRDAVSVLITFGHDPDQVQEYLLEKINETSGLQTFLQEWDPLQIESDVLGSPCPNFPGNIPGLNRRYRGVEPQVKILRWWKHFSGVLPCCG
jgi:hypothetical protein